MIDDPSVLTTPAEVTRRIEGIVTEEMLVVIGAKIEDASDLARHYGDPSWTVVTCPPVVKRVVASAVARFMQNPGGLSQSRAADETLAWQDVDTPGSVYFTPDEIGLVERAARAASSKFGSVATWKGPRERAGDAIYVPIWPGPGKDFPFGVASGEVWQIERAAYEGRGSRDLGGYGPSRQ